MSDDDVQIFDRPERQTWGRPGRGRGEESSSRREEPSSRRQGRWDPREEPGRYRNSSVRSATVRRHEDDRASGPTYRGDDYERRGHRYQGDDYERGRYGYQGDNSEHGVRRYQGDHYDRRSHHYQSDDYDRHSHRYEGDDYEHHGARQVVQINVNVSFDRGPRRRRSPPRHWDPYEDDYEWRKRSPPRRPSPPRYRSRRGDDYRRGPAHYEGDGSGHAPGGRGHRGYSPVPPLAPPPVPRRQQPPVPPRPQPPVPPRTPARAPRPQASGNGVWLTPKPKPAYVKPLPRDRNLIHCENCNRQHDPRLCRGPVRNGRINVCARCGSKRHMFEECWFGDPAVDDVDDFIWHPRQGLAPISTRIDLSHLEAIPGHHVRPVYSRKFAQKQYTREKAKKMRLGLPYLEKTIDYGSLQAPEFECMNTPLDPSLAGYTRGPPASRNPKQGHAQANVEMDVDDAMPIPPTADLDPNDVMPIPPAADLDVNELMPIPPAADLDVNALMPIPTDADLDVDVRTPLPMGVEGNNTGGSMPSEAPPGCITFDEFR
ncbi:hypothetical protein DL765_004953 [Monosporascus sp. GIB2]|nr:hypothetical protein DL765_004953 [Monosporascus sp. GIB2]